MRFHQREFVLTVLTIIWCFAYIFAQQHDKLALSRRRLRNSKFQLKEERRALGQSKWKDREFVDEESGDVYEAYSKASNKSKNKSKNKYGSYSYDYLSPSTIPTSDEPSTLPPIDEEGNDASEAYSKASNKSTDKSKNKSKNKYGSYSYDYLSPSTIPTSDEPSVSPSQNLERPTENPSFSSSFSSLHPSIPESETSSSVSYTNYPTSQPTSSFPSQSPSIYQSSSFSDGMSVAPSSFDLICDMTSIARRDQIFGILENVSSSSELMEVGSSANMAFNWLVDEDDFLICPSDEKLIQRYVLAKIYFQTEGDMWLECSRPSSSQGPNPTCEVQDVPDDHPSLEGLPWLDSSHECNWAYITCDEELCVTRIEVDENSVSGTLVNEIDFLTQLEVFTMDGAPNKIGGTIPSQFGNVTNLRILDLDENALTGSIPEEIYMLSSLEQLDLDSNSLTGTISTRIGNLSKLEFIQLFSNPIGGSIPFEISLLTELRAVGLHDMNLTGSIPSELCDNLFPNGTIEFLWADCGTGIGFQIPEVSCECCDFCL